MTAALTNASDGFTQYADFALVVSKLESDVPEVYNLLDYNMMTAENPLKISVDIILPLSLPGYNAEITWESDDDAIAVNNATGVGTVVRPSGKQNKSVTLTAKIKDQTVSVEKTFLFDVLTTYESPEPKLIAEEIYMEGGSETSNASELAELGWEIDKGYENDGTLALTNANGITITKTKTAGGVGNVGFAATKKLLAVQEGFNNDPYMTVRQENFKGKKYTFSGDCGGNAYAAVHSRDKHDGVGTRGGERCGGWGTLK